MPANIHVHLRFECMDVVEMGEIENGEVDDELISMPDTGF